MTIYSASQWKQVGCLLLALRTYKFNGHVSYFPMGNLSLIAPLNLHGHSCFLGAVYLLDRGPLAERLPAS